MSPNASFEKIISDMKCFSPSDFDNLDWKTLSAFRHLSDSFIIKYEKYLNWNVIKTHQKMSVSLNYIFSQKKNIIYDKRKNLKFNYFLEKSILNLQEQNPEAFVNLDWACLSSYHYLSDNFIEATEAYLNWNVICTHQQLSEDTIRRYEYQMNFKALTVTQLHNLSLEFILENKNKIDIKKIHNRLLKITRCSYWYYDHLTEFQYINSKLGFSDDTLLHFVNKEIYSLSALNLASTSEEI